MLCGERSHFWNSALDFQLGYALTTVPLWLITHSLYCKGVLSSYPASCCANSICRWCLSSQTQEHYPHAFLLWLTSSITRPMFHCLLELLIDGEPTFRPWSLMVVLLMVLVVYLLILLPLMAR